MKSIKILLAFLILQFLFSMEVLGQSETGSLHANGKIYIVITVICIGFIGITAFLFYIDKRIKKVEKFLDNDQDE